MIPMIKSAYVFGPIHLFGSDYLPIYKRLMKICRKYCKNVLGTYPDFWNSKESPEQFYVRTYRTVTKCSLFIAEVSVPSHGVGMELQMAVENKIPVIILAKTGVKISSMVEGLPVVKETIYYDNAKDLEEKLEKYLAAFRLKDKGR